MKKLIITTLVFLVFASVNTYAQEVELWPTIIIMNHGTGIYEVALDKRLSGSLSFRDAKGRATIKVQLDDEKKTVSVQIPERNISYSGIYSSMYTILYTPEDEEFLGVSCIAIVEKWKNWSQDEALDLLDTELSWRLFHKFTLLVDEFDQRVYVTTEASSVIKKIGATLTAEEFKHPPSRYVHNFKNYKGAIIFDGKDSKLFMRQIDEKGRDSTFQIKKNGEVKPVK